MAAAPPIPVDDQGCVAVDLPCLECGYNLRTQPLATGRCPECSLPVGRSAIGNKLRYCDPAWLRRVGWGLNLFAVCLVLVGGWAGSLSVTSISVASDAWLLVPATCWACLVVAGCYAIWYATQPDPMTRKDEWRVNPRKTARVALVVMVTLPVLIVLAEVYSTAWLLGSTALGAIWFVSLCIGILSLFAYAAQLARRAEAKALMWFARVSVVAPLIASAFLAAMSVNVFGWRDAAEAILTPYLGVSVPIQYTLQSGQTQTYMSTQVAFGPIRFDGWWEVWDTLSWLSTLATAGSVLLGVAALLWLWPIVWRQARLARESWASDAAGLAAS